MKQLPRILAILFGVLFAVSLFYSLETILTLSGALARAGGGGEPREYHVALFLPATPSMFFDRVVAGATEAAGAQGVAISVHPIDVASPEFPLARHSGIDGVIIYPSYPEERLRPLLEQLDSVGIPVVLIEHGVADEWPWSFVGTNSFDLGRRMGELAAEALPDPVNLALVYSEKSPGVASERELVELGINTTMGRRLAGPVLRKQTGLNPLDAENLTYRILRDEPHVNVLVFTDPADTLAAVQVIIDLNLVGRVQVIGFGMTETIQNYLDQGILAATIVVNPRQIGADSVRVLAGLIREGYSPGYVDTGVQVVRGTR